LERGKLGAEPGLQRGKVVDAIGQ